MQNDDSQDVVAQYRAKLSGRQASQHLSASQTLMQEGTEELI